MEHFIVLTLIRGKLLLQVLENIILIEDTIFYSTSSF